MSLPHFPTGENVGSGALWSQRTSNMVGCICIVTSDYNKLADLLRGSFSSSDDQMIMITGYKTKLIIEKRYIICIFFFTADTQE